MNVLSALPPCPVAPVVLALSDPRLTECWHWCRIAQCLSRNYCHVRQRSSPHCMTNWGGDTIWENLEGPSEVQGPHALGWDRCCSLMAHRPTGICAVCRLCLSQVWSQGYSQETARKISTEAVYQATQYKKMGKLEWDCMLAVVKGRMALLGRSSSWDPDGPSRGVSSWEVRDWHPFSAWGPRLLLSLYRLGKQAPSPKVTWPVAHS